MITSGGDCPGFRRTRARTGTPPGPPPCAPNQGQAVPARRRCSCRSPHLPERARSRRKPECFLQPRQETRCAATRTSLWFCRVRSGPDPGPIRGWPVGAWHGPFRHCSPVVHWTHVVRLRLDQTLCRLTASVTRRMARIPQGPVKGAASAGVGLDDPAVSCPSGNAGIKPPVLR